MNEISFTNVTDGSGVDGPGYFDVAMKSIGLHIDDALEDQRLTQEQAGEVYVAVIGNVLSITSQFELQKEIKDEELANTKLKGEGLAQDIAVKADQADELLKKLQLDVIEKEKATQRADDDAKRKQEMHEAQLETVALSQEKTEREIADKESIIKARDEQVIDQRYIKTIEKLGNMLGATMNGGLLPDKGMLESFFTYIAKLNGIRTIYVGTVDMSTDQTDLVMEDNTDITYPYGGEQTNDPDKRNDFRSAYYTVSVAGTGTTASGDADTTGVTADWEVGDLVMQSGTPENPKWARVQNKIEEQE